MPRSDKELYNSAQNASDAAGLGIKFTSPIVSNGKVSSAPRTIPVGTTNPHGELDVYGEITSRCDFGAHTKAVITTAFPLTDQLTLGGFRFVGCHGCFATPGCLGILPAMVEFMPDFIERFCNQRQRSSSVAAGDSPEDSPQTRRLGVRDSSAGE